MTPAKSSFFSNARFLPATAASHLFTSFLQLLHRCQLQTPDTVALGSPYVEAINSPFPQLVCTFVVQLLDVAFLPLRLCLGCKEVPPLPNVSDFPDPSSHTSAGSATCCCSRSWLLTRPWTRRSSDAHQSRFQPLLVQPLMYLSPVSAGRSLQTFFVLRSAKLASVAMPWSTQMRGRQSSLSQCEYRQTSGAVWVAAWSASVKRSRTSENP